MKDKLADLAGSILVACAPVLLSYILERVSEKNEPVAPPPDTFARYVHDNTFGNRLS